tara:strand:+ start:738 stop:944 length:207 start_codon:yes stop_codon:yes gene_type:complete
MKLIDLSDDIIKKIFSYTEIGLELNNYSAYKVQKYFHINRQLAILNLELFCFLNKARRQLIKNKYKRF